MPDFGAYAGYILGSYAITGLILGWMIAGSLLAARHARIRLARIEEMRAMAGSAESQAGDGSR